jgi:tellurite resistance protein
MVTADPRTASPRRDTPPGADGPRLQHLPVTVFAVVMGLGGTATAWQRASTALGTPRLVGDALAWLAVAVFAVLVGAYATKVARFLPAVRAEWRHPVKLAFVPTGSIALVILSLALVDLAPALSSGLWWAGASAQLVLTLDVLRTWISDPRFALNHVHPAWFIPVVGNLVVPLAGVLHAPRQLAWFFFSVGLVYWLTLLPLVLGRLVLGGALPDRLAPTLAVLVAPPAVATLAWIRLGGRWGDPAAMILLSVTIFQLLLLAVQAGSLRRVPFALSSWAYTFPLAAATSALLAAGHAGVGAGYTWLGTLALAVTTSIVLGLSARTLLAVRRGEICRPERP